MIAPPHPPRPLPTVTFVHISFYPFRRANTIGARLKEHSVLKLKLERHNLPSHRVNKFSDFFFRSFAIFLNDRSPAFFPLNLFVFIFARLIPFDTANVCDNIANLRLILGCILYRTTMTLTRICADHSRAK